MTSTTYIPRVTPISSSWLNDINRGFYGATGVPGTGAYYVSRDFAVDASSSPGVVKTALQAAIATAGAQPNGGTVVVEGGLNYGYKVADSSTWPDFSGIAKPVLVIDNSYGADYGVYPTAYNGLQTRYFYHTPQTTSPGQHDGNTMWLRGAWAPYLILSNDMDLSGSRLATDNRRCAIAYYVRGTGTWAVGQGFVDSASLNDEELSDFSIEKYSRTGDTLGAYSPYVVQRKTSYVSYGRGTHAPSAHHEFGRASGSAPTYIMKLLSDSTTSDLVLQESSGAANGWVIKNVSGTLKLTSVGLGDALSVDTSRRTKTLTSFANTRVAVTYAGTISIDATVGNIFQVTATNNTAFTINAPTSPGDGQTITITIRNSSGGALGAVTWNAVFKMASWTSPANGFSRSIDFYYDGVNWIEKGRTASDIPN